MTTEKLFKILTLVNGVRSSRWETVMSIHDCIHRGDAIVKEKKWGNFKKDFLDSYPLDLSKLDTWSTFDNSCIDLYFTNSVVTKNKKLKNKLICKVLIYDGDSFGGERRDLRFNVLIELPDFFLSKIKMFIETQLSYYLEDEYNDYLESQKNDWIKNKRKKIFL